MARSVVPPGFRFHPTDAELVVHYLKKKVSGGRLEEGVIGEVDIYKFEPSDLPGLSVLQSRDPEWYFYNVQDKKHLHGSRTNRTTRAGFWKATGKDRQVSVGSCIVGMKKTLVYHLGRSPSAERTDWIMHEYKLDEKFEKRIKNAKPYVLCRVRRKGGPGPRNGEQYGAPVLELNQEDEADLFPGHSLVDVREVPSELSESLEQGEGLERLLQDMESLGSEEYVDSFLQSLIAFEAQEHPVEGGFISGDSFLDLDDNRIEARVTFEPTQAASTNFLDLGVNGMEDLHDMLHPSSEEADMLGEMLHIVAGQVETPHNPVGMNDGMALQDLALNQASFDNDCLCDVGYLELADLEDSLELADLEDSFDEFIANLPLESGDSRSLEELIFELDSGIEIRKGSRWVQEGPGEQGLAARRLRLQLPGLDAVANTEGSITNLQHPEASGTIHGQLASEVLLDDSGDLNDVNNIQSALLTLNGGSRFSGDLSSGFGLNSDNEAGVVQYSTHAFMSSQSSSYTTYEQVPPQISQVDNVDLQHGDPIASAAIGSTQEETDLETFSPEEYNLIDSPTHSVPAGEGASAVARSCLELDHPSIEGVVQPVLEAAHDPSVSSSTLSSLSPTSIVRVILGFLGNVPVLPASAAELPVELGRLNPLSEESSDSSRVSEIEIELGRATSPHTHSLSNIRPFLHHRVKLNPSLDVEQVAGKPDIQLGWSLTHVVSVKGLRKSCKSFSSGFSVFLFWVATSALILFCLFRGFCRFTRRAFTGVL